MEKVDQVLYRCDNCCPPTASKPSTPTINPSEVRTTTTCKPALDSIKPMINPVDPVDYELVERKQKRRRRPTTTEKPVASEPCDKSSCLFFKHRRVKNGHLFECACADPLNLTLDFKNENKQDLVANGSPNKFNADATTLVAEVPKSGAAEKTSSTSSTTVSSTTVSITSTTVKPTPEREKEEGC